MSKTKKKTVDTKNELLENPDALADQLTKAEEFIGDKKNRALVSGVGAVILLIVAAVIGYNFYTISQNEEAESEIFQAEFYFEADSLGKALNGDGNNYGFLDIIDKYGSTHAANRANYYAGAIYLKLADFENAIRYLQNFSSSDLLIQAQAYALIGDAYMEQKDYSNAISYYDKAASYKENKEFTPLYLQKKGIAAEAAGDKKVAAEAYARIIKKYKKSPQYQDARKQKSRLEGLLQAE